LLGKNKVFVYRFDVMMIIYRFHIYNPLQPLPLHPVASILGIFPSDPSTVNQTE